jgi:RNA polymerase sigma factor (sigma-70 family)
MVKTKLPASIKADERNKKNVDAYLAGDTSAVGRLYEDNYNYVKTALNAKLKNKSEVAEDLAQDVMIKMMNNLGSFKNTETLFRSWLVSILNSVFIDYTRKSKRNLSYEPLDGFDSSSDEGDSESFDNVVYNSAIVGGKTTTVLENIYLEERKAALTKAINGLGNPVYRRIMKKLMEGKTYEEIAKETGENINTVKSSIFRIKNEFRSNEELAEIALG